MTDAIREQPAADESLASLFSRVVHDAEQVARSEIELQKLKLFAKLDEAKLGVILIVIALMGASLALTALVVGALLSLQPVVGPLWATAIVVGVLLFTAGLCGWLAIRQFKLLFGGAKA